MEDFSLDTRLLKEILTEARPLGHNQKPHNLNLGFGFLYYGLTRALRPRHTVVIGSGFGFSVVCLALGAKDNGKGQVTFVDPSFSVLRHGPFKTVGGTGRWDDPERVQAHFRRFGVAGIVTHHKLTSAEFFAAYDGLDLPRIDLGFIDGSHAYESVKFDFVNVLRHSGKNSYIFLHDSNIYVREAIRHAGVKRWLKVLGHHKDLFELIDFPFSSGVALVRVLSKDSWKHLP